MAGFEKGKWKAEKLAELWFYNVIYQKFAIFSVQICQIPQILSKITKNKRENDEKDYRTAKFAKKRP